MLAPIFLFTIENQRISTNPLINQEILSKFATKDKNEQTQELVLLEEELGLNNSNADFDIFELTQRLKSVRELWPWIEDINSEKLSDISFKYTKKEGIFNKAIVIQADKSTYTQGLESELTSLKTISENNYKNTALYKWIHPEEFTQKDSDLTLNTDLLEVLPLNQEQSLSIQKALSSNLTIVTGPPGTGKSQVVTDLLINAAWKKKTALFSSKNNKAVDVVDQRVNNIGQRPIMQRLGRNQSSQKLVEYLQSLLSITDPQKDAIDEYNEFSKIYDNQVQTSNRLKENKLKTLHLRNRVDQLEQKVCIYRDDYSQFIGNINKEELDSIKPTLNIFLSDWQYVKKYRDSLIGKILWIFKKEELTNKVNASCRSTNTLLSKYSLPNVSTNDTEDSLNTKANTINDKLSIFETIYNYSNTLSELKKTESLETIDEKLYQCKAKLAKTASSLWNQWLKISIPSIKYPMRTVISDFVTEVQQREDIDFYSAGNSELKKTYNSIQEHLKNILPICSVTSLSVKSRLPFTPGLFDLLIIDEASQCDIASILPLLYRAKSAIIIGDPKQLNHITTGITDKQDIALREKYNIAASWSYKFNSLYNRAESLTSPDNIISLRDHHRCHADIINYSNREFYNGALRIATDYNKLKIPSKDKPGIRWINIIGNTFKPHNGSALNQEEIEAIISELKRLSFECQYKGSIGVVTPFRAQVEAIRKRLESESELYNKILAENQFMVDTVHKFQGDERDIMLFSTVISKGSTAGCIAFLNHTGNLFNVAITRARSALIVVGDMKFCEHSQIDYLNNFVKYTNSLNIRKEARDYDINSYSREYPNIDVDIPISEWEKTLYTSLYDAGIKTIPQYKVDKYYLDLALIIDDKKLDIEIDGERYHRDWNGELCYKDQLRNQRLFELGWDVRRFWVYQLRDELPWCIQEIKNWIKKQKSLTIQK